MQKFPLPKLCNSFRLHWLSFLFKLRNYLLLNPGWLRLPKNYCYLSGLVVVVREWTTAQRGFCFIIHKDWCYWLVVILFLAFIVEVRFIPFGHRFAFHSQWWWAKRISSPIRFIKWINYVACGSDGWMIC